MPVSEVVCAIRAGISVVSRTPGSDEARDRHYVVAELPDGQPTIVLKVTDPWRGSARRAVPVDTASARPAFGWPHR